MKRTHRQKKQLGRKPKPALQISKRKYAVNSTTTTQTLSLQQSLSQLRNLYLPDSSQRIKLSIFNRFISFLRVIRIELLIGLLALFLSLGQYFQSGIAIRINITSIWREGYTSENRDRVTKFRYLRKQWNKERERNPSAPNPDDSVPKLVFPDKLYSNDPAIKTDDFIKELVFDEINIIKHERKPRDGDYEPTNEDYIQAALKYRNAIIETLNTAEAVKAVIEARPLPFRSHLLYSDTLEGRYRDIIEELKVDLGSFIESYRKLTEGRDTKAWFVLDSVESYRNDYIVIGMLVLALILILVVIYFIKKQYRKIVGGGHSQSAVPDPFINWLPD